MPDYFKGTGAADDDASKAKNAPTWSTEGTQEMANVHQVDDTPGDDLMRVPTVDKNAYKNPVGDQSGAWKAGMSNMLGATTGQAPQMEKTNAGPAAQLGPTATYGGAKMDQGQYNQSWNAQWQLANQLGAMAAGQGPSMAQAQAQRSAEQSLANQMAMLGSQRGASNPAMAQYQAQQLGAQSMQQAAQQAVAGRTQEQMSALQAQGQLLGGMNQQAQQFAGNQAQLTQQGQLASMGAINQQQAIQAQMNQQQAQFQAGMYQDANQANMQAQMAQQSLNAQQYNNYMSMLQQQNMAQWQAQMAYQQQQASNYLVAAGIEKDLSINQANMEANIVGAGTGLVSGIIAAGAQALSDKSAKKNISSGKKQLGEALEELYNNPKFLKMLMIL